LNCAGGGVRVDVGLDNGDGGGTARDNVLQTGEIDQTSYVCNADIIRPNVMVCGTTGKDVSLFFPPGYSFTRVSGCTPDNQTQALLVVRSSAPTGLASYVANGGVVITEYTMSDEVFSAIFSTVTQGNRFGYCSDVAPTVYQYNASDPMWVSVGWTSIPDAQSGCGYDVSAFPGITPLAGWSSSSVSIGYRNSGTGRLWLADFDWQDGYNDAYTNKIMGYMITHRR
jgi:hypothetical protein